jgi:hypothetical protein
MSVLCAAVLLAQSSARNPTSLPTTTVLLMPSWPPLRPPSPADAVLLLLLLRLLLGLVYTAVLRSSLIFSLFDDLLFVNAGDLLYDGPCADLAPTLSGLRMQVRLLVVTTTGYCSSCCCQLSS